MNPENALETLSDTVQLRPVVELDELVVLHPGGQLGKAEVVPVLHRLKNLRRHLEDRTLLVISRRTVNILLIQINQMVHLQVEKLTF